MQNVLVAFALNNRVTTGLTGLIYSIFELLIIFVGFFEVTEKLDN